VLLLVGLVISVACRFSKGPSLLTLSSFEQIRQRRLLVFNAAGWPATTKNNSSFQTGTPNSYPCLHGVPTRLTKSGTLLSTSSSYVITKLLVEAIIDFTVKDAMVPMRF
jgi:hypothetical protein